MKRFIRILARLYPEPWRVRYGAEFDQLLADAKPGWRGAVDVFTGALRMQFTKWGYGRFAALGLVSGLAISLGVAFSIPKQWRSEAVIKVQVSSEREATEIMNRVTQEAITRSSLTKTIMTDRLYSVEQRRMPLEDVILKMRSRVKITKLAAPGEFSIGFEYPERDAAQRATAHLLAGLIDRSIVDVGPLTVRAADGTMRWRSFDGTLRAVAPPTLPANPSYPPRRAITMAGVLGGMIVGLAFGFLLRRRRVTA